MTAAPNLKEIGGQPQVFFTGIVSTLKMCNYMQYLH